MARADDKDQARNKGKGKSQDRNTLVSRKLSRLLRHDAENQGLKLGAGGYLPLSDVLKTPAIRGLKTNLGEIKELVKDNDKQRYSLLHSSSSMDDPDSGTAALANSDSDPANYLIRANQGHSLHVSDEGLIKPLTLNSDNLPSTVVHGTHKQAWRQIVQSGGLKPMGRNHIHFATGLPKQIAAEQARQQQQEAQESAVATAANADVEALPDTQDAADVVSGMRNTSTVFMFVDLRKALEAGISFGLSNNGVVLSPGNDTGLVPLGVFARVEERSGAVLLKDGALI